MESERKMGMAVGRGWQGKMSISFATLCPRHESTPKEYSVMTGWQGETLISSTQGTIGQRVHVKPYPYY